MVVNLDASGRLKQANALFSAGDIKQAHQICVDLIQQRLLIGDAYHLLAQIHLSLQQFQKAAELCKHAIKNQDKTDFRVTLCRAYALLGQTDAVLAIAGTVPPSATTTAYQADTLGVALSGCNEHEKALEYFTQAVERSPTTAYLYNYAVSCKFCGELEKAQHALHQLLDTDPDYYQAHFALSELTTGDQAHTHIQVLQNKLSNSELALEPSLHLSHALARELEKQKDYHRAFTVLRDAKAKKQRDLPYNPEADKALFGYLSEQFSQADAITASTPSQSTSERPIFIVGMPRSGTTLVERILSSHADVSSGGELQDFSMLLKQISGAGGHQVLDVPTLQQAETVDYNLIASAYLQRTAHIGKTKHFVDKLPFNFFYLPYIRRAFPNAKILCLLRDPLDTCVGNYRQLFSIQNPHYHYTQTLEDCADFYQQFSDWVHQWQTVDSDNFLLLSYEALTAEPEKHIPALIEFCGLPWDDRCMAMEHNTAPVSTASKMQVKEPINQRSVGRWKRYQPFTDVIESRFR